MGLEKYIKKRDFTKTSEPKSGKSAGKELRFVIQRHHASRLHYDFRLEMEGVLKSWAVPKGPSLNPKDKRLAMMVEDHPYDYRTFEGTIPAGNYGGGVVHIFDEGTYEALEGGTEKDLLRGLHSGDLKFSLKGKVIKGEFALVKIKSSEDNAWLLIKHKDKFAVDSKFDSEDLVSTAKKQMGIDFKKKDKKVKSSPIAEVIEEAPEQEESPDDSNYRPMLAKLAPEIFDDPDWIYEKKLDGYRALAFTNARGKTKLISRNGKDFLDAYAMVSAALDNLKLDAVIDGEVVAENKSGRSDFQMLQNYKQKGTKPELKFYVFDLLRLNGHDLRNLELIKRKELLKVIIEKLKEPAIIYSEHISGTGKKLLDEAEKNGWEGIIGKKGDSTYSSDKRSGHWLKFKLNKSQEAVIIGFTKPAGSRSYFGSLVLAMYDDGRLVYTGNCGTGFNEASLKLLHKQMDELITGKKPVKERVDQERTITWIKPELVCDVTFTEWTADRHLRHPVFKGLRTDKSPDSVTIIPAEAGIISPEKPAKRTKPGKGLKTSDRLEKFGNKTLKLTNLDKVYWPLEGLTKGNMLEYYDQVADYILPHLKDRALSLNRHPNGITGPNFFQKDLDTQQIPSWIKYAPLYSESNDKNIDYLVCNDKPTLLWMANLGCIEINPWLSTYKKPANPLFAVLDLDPHDLEFIEVVKVAITAKKLLDQMKIKAFIKTSGSKGLHIFIPTGGKYDYEITKSFINFLGQMIMEEHPDTTSLERSPSKRKNRIYLDFLQNRRGQTIAAPYSLRPKPGATVSTPLEWDEVNEDLHLKNYTIFNTLERIGKRGDLWKDILKEKADLKKALQSLKA